ncbi:hypothetical protein ACVGVM_16090 [Pseudonocardia bannensis]|uniref:Uncharacterized protein n=1 Tax=Pseudonocardia bannensis TaxID=630973 RepID=A0A848DEM6_9PSEU|nr:hypothetical protein [Pseudonocardia bannensis]NMH91034.1 hypothetical protein [Pseudonocardia bannensis]
MAHTDEQPDRGPQIPVVTEVSPGQVRAARFRVSRDSARGRCTPARIVRLARVVLPGDHPHPA